VAVEDLEAMFVEKRLPVGSESWKKSSADWLESMAGLALSAAAEHHALKGA
jgi:hypothetical protein